MGASALVSQIPAGDAGSLVTLRKMRDIVNAAILQPLVVERAHAIVRNVPSRNDVALIQAIRDWMTRYFRFVRDPLGVELLRTPEYMLRQFDSQMIITGDCDDAAILGGAFAKSIGIAATFVAIGFRAFGPLQHVYVIAHPRGQVQAINLDVTRPAGATAQVYRTTTLRV